MVLPVGKIITSHVNIFYLTSPNAPTGVAFSNAEIAAILENFPGLLVVDEAYVDFAVDNAVPLLAQYRRLVITRSFSKTHALAGLRVGCALAAPEIIGTLEKVRDSYNVNRLSQAGALAAIQDKPYYDKIIKKIIKTRDDTYEELKERGWFVYPSQTNFLCAEPINWQNRSSADVARDLFEYLKRNKILVRYFDGVPLTASFLRISIGTEPQNRKLVRALKAIL